MSGYSMKCGVVLGGLLIALAAATPVASAGDDAKITAFNNQVSDLMRKALDYEDPRWNGNELSNYSDASLTECGDAVAAGKAAGLSGSSRVSTNYIDRRPNAHKDDKGDYYLTLDEVQSFCKDYNRLVIQEWTEAAVVPAFDKKKYFDRPIEGMHPSDAERAIGYGEVCNERVDAALAAKFPASHVISDPLRGLEVKLGDAKAEYCQPVLDWGKQRLADINGAADAKVDEIAKVYAAVGIKGDRFKLFSEVGLPEKSGFLAPGCTKYVDTAKGLAKAKKLFTWFESDDGSIVVTKYTFKGNKYKESEKRYLTSARAYKGCK